MEPLGGSIWLRETAQNSRYKGKNTYNKYFLTKTSKKFAFIHFFTLLLFIGHNLSAFMVFTHDLYQK